MWGKKKPQNLKVVICVTFQYTCNNYYVKIYVIFISVGVTTNTVNTNVVCCYVNKRIHFLFNINLMIIKIKFYSHLSLGSQVKNLENCNAGVSRPLHGPPGGRTSLVYLEAYCYFGPLAPSLPVGARAGS